MIICTFLAFFVGVVAGIISCIRSVDGEFERVARADMEFGAAKVFSSLFWLSSAVIL